jgi:hypothetical protein
MLGEHLEDIILWLLLQVAVVGGVWLFCEIAKPLQTMGIF